MEIMSNGNKDVLSNFKIPRKNEKLELSAQNDANLEPASILSNTYNEYLSQPQGYSNSIMNPWTQYAMQYYQANQIYGNIDYCQGSLKRPRDSLQTSGTTYREASNSDLQDLSLPKELTSLFQPLYCKLCSMQLSSNSMAKLHYKSKNHEKKVRKFLVDHSEKTGEPLHKRAMVSTKQKEENDQDPRYFHCDVCDLQLTGKLHAESHYMGKNHQKALSGKTKPSGKGYYNPDGQWVRTVPAKSDETLRGDSFGLGFISVQVPPEEKHSLKCDICNVTVTSQQMLNLHHLGKKHQKKLKVLNATNTETTVDNILSSVFNLNGCEDLSVFRTPSGSYYCKPCDLTLYSETQFKQHLGSKKHRKNTIATG